MNTVSADNKEEEARRSAIESLQKLYSVIIAIALTSALAKLVMSLEMSGSRLEQLRLVAISIAFLSTVVPFYHGMERHLYESHWATHELGPGGRPIPLLVDIFVFIIEGGILFSMGRYLDNPEMFLRLWSALLIVDIIWTLIVWRVQKSKWPRWALNNFIWLVVAWVFWIGSPCFLTNLHLSAPLQLSVMVWLIAVIEICRSIVDYKSNWSFYFPG